MEIRVDDKRTGGHIYLLIEEQIRIIYEFLLLPHDGGRVIVEVHPYFLVLEGVLALGKTGVVAGLAVSTVAHHCEEFVQFAARGEGVLGGV